MSLTLQPLRFENAWVQGVDDAERRAPGWLWALVALGVAMGSVALARTLVDVLAARAAPPSPLVLDAAATGAAFGVLWLVALAGGVFEGRLVWRRGGGGVDVGLGLIVGAVGYLAAVGLAALSGHLVAGTAGAGLHALPGALAGLGLIAFQASAEEVYFRGWLQPVLCARWGVWVGLLATSALFALLHLAGGARSPMALLNLMLGGLVFGLLALRSGGLWAPFAAHLAWNWVEACLLGLDTNPGVGPTGSVMDLDLAGTGPWSGGADAMNGSLAATLVLAVLTAALVLCKARPATAAALASARR